MTYTINRLNQIVRAADRQLNYEVISSAADALTDAYITNNLTIVGLEAGIDNQGFISITTQIDYDGDTVLGNSLALMKTNNVVGTNTTIGPGSQTINNNKILYELNYDAITGCNPDYGAEPEAITMTVAIGRNTGRSPTPSNLNRHILTGSMYSVEASLRYLNGRTGAFGPGEGISMPVPAITITNNDINVTLEALSPL